MPKRSTRQSAPRTSEAAKKGASSKTSPPKPPSVLIKAADVLKHFKEDDVFSGISYLTGLIHRHNGRVDTFDLLESVQTWSKRDLEHVWTKIDAAVEAMVENAMFLSQSQKEEMGFANAPGGDDGCEADEERAELTSGEQVASTNPSEFDAGKSQEEGAGLRPRSLNNGERREEHEQGDEKDQFGDDDDDDDAEEAAMEDDLVSNCLSSFNASTQFAHICFQLQDFQPCGQMLQTIARLHDILFFLRGVEGEAVQVSIARLCERWWCEEQPGAELLVTQLLPYLLMKSLEPDCRDSDIKRVANIRSALLLLDFEDESILTLNELLLRCFVNPRYLKNVDGKKFLAFLFGLHPSFIEDIHATVLNQIPYQSKTIVRGYGEVYFRAWQGATGVYKLKIEEDCIQDFINRAVHAGSAALFAQLRRLLGVLHSHKKNRGVDEMLYRLYSPILWRSLKATNATVRLQAAYLLIDVFPLHPGDENVLSSSSTTTSTTSTSSSSSSSSSLLDAELHRQFSALQHLLADTSPAVRVAGAEGCCRVLGLFWEFVPASAAKSILSTLVCRLSADSSSALVRATVLRGIAFVLDNHLAHAAVAPLLPSLGGLLWDRSPAVRLALVQLLVKVKKVRGVRVVPVDELLHRMAQDKDQRKIREEFTKLFLNSYFPQDADGEQQATRCLAFIRRNPEAAAAFYSSVCSFVSAGSVCRLAALLLHYMLSVLMHESFDAENDKTGQIDTENGEEQQQGEVEENEKAEENNNNNNKRNKTKNNKQSKAHDVAQKPRKRKNGIQNEDTDSVALPPNEADIALCASVVEIMWLLLNSVSDKLKNSEPHFDAMRTFVREQISGKHLQTLLNVVGSADEQARLYILKLVSLLPAEDAPEINENLLPGLVCMTAATPMEDIKAIVHLLCSWGRERELLRAISVSLQKMTGVFYTSPSLSLLSAQTEADLGADARESRSERLELTIALRALECLFAQQTETRAKIFAEAEEGVSAGETNVVQTLLNNLWEFIASAEFLVQRSREEDEHEHLRKETLTNKKKEKTAQNNHGEDVNDLSGDEMTRKNTEIDTDRTEAVSTEQNVNDLTLWQREIVLAVHVYTKILVHRSAFRALGKSKENANLAQKASLETPAELLDLARWTSTVILPLQQQEFTQNANQKQGTQSFADGAGTGTQTNPAEPDLENECDRQRLTRFAQQFVSCVVAVVAECAVLGGDTSSLVQSMCEWSLRPLGACGHVDADHERTQMNADKALVHFLSRLSLLSSTTSSSSSFLQTSQRSVSAPFIRSIVTAALHSGELSATKSTLASYLTSVVASCEAKPAHTASIVVEEVMRGLQDAVREEPSLALASAEAEGVSRGPKRDNEEGEEENLEEKRNEVEASLSFSGEEPSLPSASILGLLKPLVRSAAMTSFTVDFLLKQLTLHKSGDNNNNSKDQSVAGDHESMELCVLDSPASADMDATLTVSVLRGIVHLLPKDRLMNVTEGMKKYESKLIQSENQYQGWLKALCAATSSPLPAAA